MAFALVATALFGQATRDAADSSSNATPDVVTRVDSAGRETVLTGEILEFIGPRLTLLRAGGTRQTIELRSLVRATPGGLPAERLPDDLFAQRKFGPALEGYRRLLAGESVRHDWRRRWMIARAVQCYMALDQPEQAGAYFLILLDLDPPTAFYDVVPLCWTSKEPTPAAVAAAGGWLAQTDKPVARLLGASYLLSTPKRGDALKALEALAANADERIAFLARAQKFRALSFEAKPAEALAFSRTIDLAPPGLRAGAYYAAGSTRSIAKTPLAIADLLRLPLAYQDRPLSAAALARVASWAETDGDLPLAVRLNAELARNYAELPEGRAAAGRVEGHAAGLATPSDLAEPTARVFKTSPLVVDREYLSALRENRLYVPVEHYCRDRLTQAELTVERRLELTAALCDTLARHAAELSGKPRAALWDEAVKALAEPTLAGDAAARLRLQLQLALLRLSQAEILRNAVDDPAQASPARDEALGALRETIAACEALQAHVAAARRSSAEGSGGKAVAQYEIGVLELRGQYVLARAFLCQSQLFVAGNADQLNALLEAQKLLEPLAKLPPETPIVGMAPVELARCHRLMGQFDSAAKDLQSALARRPALDMARALMAERIRLALAMRQVEVALKLGQSIEPAGTSAAADLDCARLETLLAAAAADRLANDQTGAESHDQRSAQLVAEIEARYGDFWMRRAEALVAASLGGGQGDSIAALALAAESRYRAGQWRESLTAYDRAVRAAATKGDKDKAFDLSLSAATIAADNGEAALARDRYQALSKAWPSNTRAAQAHLMAAYQASRVVPTDSAELANYRALLTEHLELWPRDATSAQAAIWLAKLAEHDRRHDDATAAFGQAIEAGAGPPAVEGAQRTFLAWMAEEAAAGADLAELTENAAKFFEQFVPPPRAQDKAWTPAAREAALAAARLRLEQGAAGLSQGYERAELLLAAALAHAADAEQAWLESARVLRISTLAMQGRADEAERMLAGSGQSSADDLLRTLTALSVGAERAGPEARANLAKLQLSLVALLKHKRLPAETLTRVDEAEAFALADAGQRADALVRLAKLASADLNNGALQERYADLLEQNGDKTEQRAALVQWRRIAQKSKPGGARWFRAQLGQARTLAALGAKPQAQGVIRQVAAVYPDYGGDLKSDFDRLLKQCAK